MRRPVPANMEAVKPEFAEKLATFTDDQLPAVLGIMVMLGRDAESHALRAEITRRGQR